MEHRPIQYGSFGFSGCQDAASPVRYHASLQHQDQLAYATADGTSGFETSTMLRKRSVDSKHSQWERDTSTLSVSIPEPENQCAPNARRIACIQKTTEEAADESPMGTVDSPLYHLEGVQDSESKQTCLEVTNGVARTLGIGYPITLHGLSLEPRKDGMTKNEQQLRRLEIQSRRPVNTSPVPSPPIAWTCNSLTPAPIAPETPKKLSKNAKKRRKKKEKRQSETSCMNLPCTRSSPVRGSTNESDLKVKSTTWMTTGVPQQLKTLLRDDVPSTRVRFYEQGIQNLGNTCFLGSAMQFLLASSKFCWLMTELKLARTMLDSSTFPVVCSLGSLANVLRTQPAKPLSLPSAKDAASPSGQVRLRVIVPDMLSPLVAIFQRRLNEERSVGGQDVQEFMLFALDHIEKEIIHIRHMFSDQDARSSEVTDPEDCDDGWMVVGRRNKVSVQRTTGSVETSIVSSIFGGIVQSEVKAAGVAASVTLHAFTTLILDIAPHNVQTVEDALDLYTARDIIPDYLIQGSGRKVMATKSNLFRQLPPYLIICLKQYTYTSSGFEKIHKPIGFGSLLEFKKNWLYEARRQLRYRLIATCNHHGQGHGGDHYTANVLQRDGNWIHFNDSSYARTSVRGVLSETPYLLMYEQL